MKGCILEVRGMGHGVHCQVRSLQLSVPTISIGGSTQDGCRDSYEQIGYRIQVPY